jgi:hypothetical protein
VESGQEVRPAAGTDRVLSEGGLRYCLSEDIRIEAARPIATSQRDIDLFNSMVRDYNARCTSYRYSEQVRRRVEREVRARTAELQAEGVARFAQ